MKLMVSRQIITCPHEADPAVVPASNVNMYSRHCFDGAFTLISVTPSLCPPAPSDNSYASSIVSTMQQHNHSHIEYSTATTYSSDPPYSISQQFYSYCHVIAESTSSWQRPADQEEDQEKPRISRDQGRGSISSISSKYIFTSTCCRQHQLDVDVWDGTKSPTPRPQLYTPFLRHHEHVDLQLA